MNRVFGRIVVKDDRDNKFRLASQQSATELKQKYWRSTWKGNQLEEPACIGFAWNGWLTNAPFKQFLNPLGIYNLAKFFDEWAGEEYSGTSVRAGAKVLKILGYIKEYRWGFTIDEVVNALLTTGPVVVGTNWYESMSGSTGLITIKGKIEGGHAYYLNGVDKRKELIRMQNSWGSLWGNKGTASITFKDFERLLSEDGEACIGIESQVKLEDYV